MKLQMTLSGKPNVMHALPLIDLLALVMLFPMLSTTLVPQAGVEVELPETDFRLQRVSNPIVLTVSGGSEPEYWVGKKQVERELLLSEVKQRAEEWKSGGSPAVLLRIDKSAQQMGVDLSMLLLKEGYRCLWGAMPAQK